MVPPGKTCGQLRLWKALVTSTLDNLSPMYVVTDLSVIKQIHVTVFKFVFA